MPRNACLDLPSPRAGSDPAKLTDAQLLGHLLPADPDRAAGILQSFGGLHALNEYPPEELGLDGSDGFLLRVALEFGQRLTRESIQRTPVLRQPARIVQYLVQRYFDLDQELFGVLFLDCNLHLMSEELLFRGSRRRATVEPRLILREALRRHADQIAVWHTHPSTDSTPSSEDLGFTRRLVEACDLMNVELTDHLILARGGRWCSLRRYEPW